jgi:hypothetical protein
MCRNRTDVTHSNDASLIFIGREAHTSWKLINMPVLTVSSQVVPIRTNGHVILSTTCTVHITHNGLVMKRIATTNENSATESLVFQTK